ncbi:META domain-containing protein [Niveispirillum cyanobacteriorum]|uniref:Uncharacterized protein n=1 Tax=Niveispirillum cyanobacteriorum TaxID=1612173 RepID=A0A2K9NIY7_9PROT|nr:META domain-containing protein [Niveispirillum cyanobacteriorum]AUN33033.1 hypothetical protein C0V82_21720 [Niveispirillum cyanobacteriorum]GGE45998.1 HslJ [Niveispirillum cyanobacteriorum]
MRRQMRKGMVTMVAGACLILPAALPPALAAPVPSSSSTARPLVTIIGELSYRERIALPPGATLLVTLAEPGMAADPAAPVLARQSIDLAGQQVPLRFRLTAVAAKLKAGERYAVRAIIQDAAGRPLWSIQSAHVIDPGTGLHDLGTLWLSRAAAPPPVPPAPPAPASGADAAPRPPGVPFQCGEREVVALYDEGGLDLTVDGQTHRLDRALSASGARYTGEIPDGREIEFWSKGRNARLSLGPETEIACAQADFTDTSAPGQYEARGYSPSWTLRIGADRLDLVRFGTGTSQIARISLPERQLLADGYRYEGRLGDGDLRVTINPGTCLDNRTGTPLPDRVQVEVEGQTLQGCGGSAAAFLAQGEWQAVSLNGKELPTDNAPSMRFTAAGEVTGQAGCNRFVARFRADANGITIASRSAASTMMACPRDVMVREQAFLTALRSIQRHTLDEAGLLVLSGLDDAEIRLRRVGGP